MPRYKLRNGNLIQLSSEEETEFQNKETAWNNGAFDRAMEELRAKRNQDLKDSDWTSLSDAPLSDAEKTEWQTYRRRLRNITQGMDDITDVENVIWPTKPGA